MLRYLLDTNICIYVIKERPWSMLVCFNRHAGHMADPERNLAAVENFCSRLDVLAYGPKASLHYGQIRAGLERQGLPIGVNDLHIAAHARSEGLTLVSNNLREFQRVDGLMLENWV